MKLKDHKGNIEDVIVEIPKEFSQEMALSGLNTNKVHIVSLWARGLWVRVNLEDERMYPICNIDPKEALEWDIVKNKRRKG